MVRFLPRALQRKMKGRILLFHFAVHHEDFLTGLSCPCEGRDETPGKDIHVQGEAYVKARRQPSPVAT